MANGCLADAAEGGGAAAAGGGARALEGKLPPQEQQPQTSPQPPPNNGAYMMKAASAPNPDLLRSCSGNTELQQKATRARATFKRPSWWVLFFGWSLAMCAGMVNVVAYRSFGFFVSHATGSTTKIAVGIEGYHHNRHEIDVLLEAVAVLLSFLVGAFACGLLIDKNHVHFGGKALYGTALIGNSLLLVAAAATFLSGGTGLNAACFCAVACGLQNAMCTSHFGAVVRTTHVTGTITDIGSTLGRMAMIFLRKRCRRRNLNVLERAEVHVDTRKLLVLGPMWFSFLLGTVEGAYLQSHMGASAMFVPAFLTFSIGCLYTLFRERLKHKLKRIEKARLQKDLDSMQESMERTKTYIKDWRERSGSRAAGDADTRTTRTDSIVAELEEGLGQMLETMHEVEADLSHLYESEADGAALGGGSAAAAAGGLDDEEAPGAALRPQGAPKRRERRAMTH